MTVTVRRQFSLLALVALFALLLPQAMWACPMTGRIGSASRVCVGLPAQNASPKLCAQIGGTCCKPLSVPPIQSDDDPHQSHLVAPPEKTSGASLIAPVQVLEAAPFSVTQAHTPVLQYFTPAQYSEPPPSFWIHYRPVSCAGRAPPV